MTSESSSASSLGEFLRGERERRGITVEQVASATKIGVKLLHALEGDQFGELPAKPFIRGFVTSYARFIGLNPSEVLTQYSDFIDRKSTERPARDSGHSGYAFERREGDNTRAMLWMVLGGFGVIGGLALLFLKSPSQQRGAPIDKLKQAHLAVTATPATAPSVEPSGVPSVVATAPAAVTPTTELAVSTTTVAATTTSFVVTTTLPAIVTTTLPTPLPSEKLDPLNSGVNLKWPVIKHKLILKALEDVCIRYQVDERPVMTFILRKDRILVLRGERVVKFQATRPSALSLNYNSSGEKPVENSRYLTTRQGDPTMIFPLQDAESLQEPFPGTRPLSGRECGSS
jgi:cytoskeletal protein RodZ